jgi:hypothetical protein
VYTAHAMGVIQTIAVAMRKTCSPTRGRRMGRRRISAPRLDAAAVALVTRSSP